MVPKPRKVFSAQIENIQLIRRRHVIALRLYPQLPVNVRFAIRPTILPRGGGADGLSPVLINKGTGIGWSSYHLHRREDIYGPDASVYRPERWESGQLLHEVAQKGGFLDFHAGPRICLGSMNNLIVSIPLGVLPSLGTDMLLTCLLLCLEDYAIMEASLAVLRILQTFPNICIPPSEPNGPVGSERQNLTITLSSADGTKVLLR